MCFGARGRFFARCAAVDGGPSVEVLKAAARHKGTSVVEVLQNCVIFNDGTHNAVAKKEDRERNAIYLEHGKPMLFGPNKEFGLMQEGFGLKVVKLGENGITEKDILVHDAHCEDHTLQLKLALMEGPDFPIALGVIRDVDAPTYDEAVEARLKRFQPRKSITRLPNCWKRMIRGRLNKSDMIKRKGASDFFVWLLFCLYSFSP